MADMKKVYNYLIIINLYTCSFNFPWFVSCFFFTFVKVAFGQCSCLKLAPKEKTTVGISHIGASKQSKWYTKGNGIAAVPKNAKEEPKVAQKWLKICQKDDQKLPKSCPNGAH